MLFIFSYWIYLFSVLNRFTKHPCTAFTQHSLLCCRHQSFLISYRALVELRCISLTIFPFLAQCLCGSVWYQSEFQNPTWKTTTITPLSQYQCPNSQMSKLLGVLQGKLFWSLIRNSLICANTKPKGHGRRLLVLFQPVTVNHAGVFYIVKALYTCNAFRKRSVSCRTAPTSSGIDPDWEPAVKIQNRLSDHCLNLEIEQKYIRLTAGPTLDSVNYWGLRHW